MPVTNPFYPIFGTRTKFLPVAPDFAPITRDHKYEDGGVSFNELGDSPQLEWEIVYDGLSQTDAAVLDAHFAENRTSRPFEFVDDRAGLLYSDCYYKSFARSHEKAWMQKRTIRVVRYPSALTPVAADLEAPTTPEMLDVTPIGTGLLWSWVPADDNVAVTGYQIQIALDSGFATIIVDEDLGDVSEYTDAGKAVDVSYFGRVRAFDASGNYSDWSNVLEGVVTAIMLSSTPGATLCPIDDQLFFDTTISSPVWTLDGNGTLSQDGTYTSPSSTSTGNKVRVHSSFWNYVNSAYFTKNADDTLTKNTATAGYFMQAKSNGYINGVGDSVEFTVPNNNTYWVGIENDATTRRFVYFSGLVREYHPSNGGGYAETDITNVIAGDVIKIEMITGGYLKMSVNGTVVVASTVQTFSSQNMRFVISADMANAVVFKCPKMVASGYSEHYATVAVV